MKVVEGGCCCDNDQWCRRRLSDPVPVPTPAAFYYQEEIILDMQQGYLVEMITVTDRLEEK